MVKHISVVQYNLSVKYSKVHYVVSYSTVKLQSSTVLSSAQQSTMRCSIVQQHDIAQYIKVPPSTRSRYSSIVRHSSAA